MRITEILTESEIQHLEEGPKLDAFGRGVGKFAGGLAKGVGAVAGGVVGAGRALAKGYRTGKAVVGDDPDPGAGAPGYQDPVEPAASAGGGATAPAPSGATAPQTTAPSTTTPPSAADINAQGPQGSAPAVAQSGAAGQALARSTSVVDQQQAQSQTKANQTVYAQVKANVDKLDKKGKQRILQLLQKSLTAPAPKAAAGAAAPGAAEPAGGAAAGADASAAPVGGTMTAPASTSAPAGTAMPTTPYQVPGAGTNPNPTTAAAPAKARGGRTAGAAPSQSASAVRRRNARANNKSANSAGAGAFGQMANTLQQQNASKEHIGNALAEALAHQIEIHKHKMFETGLARGSISIFRK
jgi:hypothetical protein